jgi:betaine-aldehyde dehydrogenase
MESIEYDYAWPHPFTFRHIREHPVSAHKQIKNFVGGTSVETRDGVTSELFNPTTGEVFATAPVSSAVDVDQAYQVAQAAFDGWRDSTPAERQLAMLKIADAFESHAEDLIALESENTGKPIAVTASEEIPPMIDQIRFFAGAARNLEG